MNTNFYRCNFSDMEIEMFFAKYDVDGDGEFSYEEGQQLIEDLDNDAIDGVSFSVVIVTYQLALSICGWVRPSPKPKISHQSTFSSIEFLINQLYSSLA